MKLPDSTEGNNNSMFEDMYFEKLDQLGITCEQHIIETSYGQAQAVVVGDPGKKPLVLLPGAIGCALLVIEASMDLTSHYSVYVVSEMFQESSALEAEQPESVEDYARWLYEIISRLDIQNITLVGFSFGGSIVARSLAYNERNISQAFLIMPEGIISPNNMGLIRSVITEHKKVPEAEDLSLYQLYLSRISTQPIHYYIERLPRTWLSSGNSFLKSSHLQLNDTVRIKTPLYVVAAEKDAIYSYRNLFKRTEALFPSFREGLLLKDSNHIPNKQGTNTIIQFILNNNR